MTDVSTQAGATPARKGLIARFVGVLVSPRETFESVVAHPKWLGMLVLTTAIVAVFTTLPMTTEAGKEAVLEQQVSQMEAFGMQVSDQQYEAMRGQVRFAPYTTAGGIVVFAPIVALIISGILFAVFNAAMGGNASFKQVLAVVVHAGAISAAGTLFTGPLNYFRGSVSSATNLGVLLPMLDEKSFVGRLLGLTDLFIIWWLLALAIGLGVLYRRRTQPIATALLGVYAIIALGIAAVMSGLGGGN